MTFLRAVLLQTQEQHQRQAQAWQWHQQQVQPDPRQVAALGAREDPVPVAFGRTWCKGQERC